MAQKCHFFSLSAFLHPSIFHPWLSCSANSPPSFLSLHPSVPVQLEVVCIQEVRWDPEWCESPARTWRHGEVQPLHIVQSLVRQAHVEWGGGWGGITEGQVWCVHGRVGLLVHQLRLQLLHQALGAWVWCWRCVGQRPLQKGLQLVVCGQGGEAGQAGVHDGAQCGWRGYLDLWRVSGEGGADRQGGDVSCDWEGFRERHWRLLLDEWSDFWKGGGQEIIIKVQTMKAFMKTGTLKCDTKTQKLILHHLLYRILVNCEKQKVF